MKRRALSWFMAAALGVGTMAGGIGSANIVLAEEQNEETEAADETSEEPADETDTDSSVMKIGALKGPTAMGMAQLLDDENYEFSLAASPDEIVPMIVQGQVDVAAVPSNLASVLYQKTDKNVSVLAVNTLGVLYLVENGDSIQSVDDLKGKTIKERSRMIGFVMQNPNQMICKPMIYDEVALGLRIRGVDEAEIDKRVEKALKICGLAPFKKWPISALSFGQKKRVTIASALVLDPKILILDEPTAGQDFHHYTEIMEFLKSLNSEGVTIIMITHDMHLMLEYTPHAIVIADGEKIGDATSAEILTNESITERANLKITSLYELAVECGVEDPEGFVQNFIDYERGLRHV